MSWELTMLCIWRVGRSEGDNRPCGDTPTATEVASIVRVSSVQCFCWFGCCEADVFPFAPFVSLYVQCAPYITPYITSYIASQHRYSYYVAIAI